MKIFIYTLSCPITGDIVYVGKTNNLRSRFNQHKKDKRNITKLKSWIISLAKKGLFPIMEIIDECDETNWENTEVFWIQQLKCWGFKLKNISNESGGVSCHSEETKLKISKKLKGKLFSEERKKKLGKKVCQYDLKGNYIATFNSETQALIHVKIAFGISNSIKRKQSAGGFQWRWLNDKYSDNIGSYVKNSASRNSDEKRKIIVQEIDIDGNIINEFASIKEAEAITNLKNISYVCSGKRRHTQNRYFKKAIDKNTLTK